MNSITAPDGILETALYADDLNAAAWFYHDLLGLKEVLRAENRHIFYKCGSGMLLIFNAEQTRTVSDKGIAVPPHGAVGEGHICFRASDEELNNWVDLFEENNISIEMDFHWPNGARSIYVRDPAGNSVEFAEPRLWGFSPSGA